jgi:diguanylate cyclase (GGDEF)-like protein
MTEPSIQDTTEKTLIRVLLADDDAGEIRRISDMLAGCKAPSFETVIVSSLELALQHIRRTTVDVLLLGITPTEGDISGEESRTRLAATGIPIVMLSGEKVEDASIEALFDGAQDRLVKGEFDKPLLVRSIRHAVERQKLTADLAEAKQREHYAATHDLLTGLINREALHAHLSQSISYASRYGLRLAVLVIDLDRFKAINDTLGHSAGDRMLRAIGERLQAAMRKSDILARLGGDVFASIVTNPEQDHDPAKLAVRLLGALGSPFGLESTQYMMTASVGIAVFPSDGDEAEALVQNAELAMRHAKEMGRGQYHFYSQDMNEAARSRLDLERGLRKALVDNQLFVQFQPQLDVDNRKVVGAEALLRWRRLDGTVVPPDRFIPIAEETGLINEMGEWVLRAACKQGNGWVSLEGVPLRIAVNVSARQLTDDQFADKVARILEEEQFDPTRLELEITESTLMEHVSNPDVAFQKLQDMGIRISIDDFGTGYSSLSALRHMPVSALKIDRSFVRDVVTDPANAKITAASLALARELGLETVAEGVETVEQMEFLQSCGCDFMQGYLFARPLMPKDLKRWLQSPNIPQR